MTTTNAKQIAVLAEPVCGVLAHPSSWQLVNATERVRVCNLCTLAWRRVYRWTGSEHKADATVKALRRETTPRRAL